MEELKKIKFRKEYEENQQIHQQQANQNLNFYSSIIENNNNNNNNYINNQESKVFNLNHFPNKYESNLFSSNNNNNNNNENNCLTESSVYNNPVNNTTGKKRIVRLSTVQPQTNYNQMLMQPNNMRFRQSKININNNIIKNITKRSSNVLNNLGFGLAFRKSVFEPNASNPVLCQMCNNFFYTNNPGSATNPNDVEIKEDGNELVNISLGNINNLVPEKSDEKENDFVNKSKDFGSNKNQVSVSNIENSTSNKPIHSKNVSFLLNEKKKKELITNDKNAENKDNKISKTLLKSTNLGNYNENELNKSNKYSDQKSDNESKHYNESDISFENFNHSKNLKTNSTILNEKPKTINSNNHNQNLISDSNKNVSTINAFNNNNMYSLTHTPKVISSIENYNSNNKIQLGFRQRNTIQNNNDLNDFEITNIKSKWEALKQSIISTNSNNNFKILKDENFSELKLAKKETVLYKNCFDSITTDYKKLKSSNKNFERILNQDLENYKKLKEAEIVKFAKALEMYNDLYSHQIKFKDIKINQLASLIDQLVEKENYSLINNLNNSILDF